MNDLTRSAVSRPSMLQLNINSKSALYAAFMPFLKRGGLFVPTPKPYQIGDEVYMLVQLLDDPTRHAVAGQVAWVTPNGALGGKVQGIGVHFAEDEAGTTVRTRIEQMLGGHLGSARPTHTL